MATSKVPVTVRIEPKLLAQVRARAQHDNRTLTNFIETALRALIENSGDSPRKSPPLHGVIERQKKSRSDG